jgi:hypothetical protein
MMLSRLSRRSPRNLLLRANKSTTSAVVKDGPIAEDGRHELWRDGQSSDHDNEPR